jgi:N-acetylglucosamine-6-phosphate deacetylase
LRNAVGLCGLSRVEAVAAVTAVPARALGLGSRFGLLENGYAADVVVLDEDLRVTTVWAAGEVIE